MNDDLPLSEQEVQSGIEAAQQQEATAASAPPTPSTSPTQIKPVSIGKILGTASFSGNPNIDDTSAIEDASVGDTGGKNRIDGTDGDDKRPPIIGTDQPDQIFALEGNDTAIGGFGDDDIFGGPGKDTLIGQGGNDNIFGGDGRDFLFGDSANDDSNFTAFGNDILNGGAGSDYLEGGNGNDTLDGEGGVDELYGEDGNDTFNGGNGNDEIYGGTGKDNIRGGSGDDLAVGQEGDDEVRGGGGNDFIYGDRPDRDTGGHGSDKLFGDAGNDTLIGGDRNDTLDGGTGNDRLIGVDPNFSSFQYGLGTRDQLTGGTNDDTFVLGQDVNGSEVVFYNEGNPAEQGIRDYALIKDFGFAGDAFVRGVDKIELAGSQERYSLGASPISSISGTGIFINEGQSTPELIGIVEGISQANLSLTNTNEFTFV